MSTWSTPYLTVTDADGQQVDWQLPDPLPWAAGAARDASLRASGELGLPVDGRIKLRWRTPRHANPRSRQGSTCDLEILALACDVRRASRAGGTGWTCDAQGVPLREETRGVPTPAASAAPVRPATDAALTPTPAAHLSAPLAGPRTIVSPANATIADIAAGRMPLGSTVAQVVQAVRREREAGWSGAHRVNMHNMLDFVEQVLVYTEPFEDDTDADLPEVAAWMRARLALPGVEVGGSVHVALLLAPDLARAIAFRAQTDRRTERLNDQAAERHHRAWVRYEAALARRVTRNYGGQAPRRPADLVLRSPQVPVEARTEELFATGLGMVLRYAEHNGLLAGPNPWLKFATSGLPNAGYRRSEHLLPHQRNVPPVGAVVAVADTIAGMGPIDPRTGRPAGHRFRAAVLVALLGPRPSEVDAFARADYVPGARPYLLATKSAAAVHTGASEDGGSRATRGRLKHRAAGESRVHEMPRFIADALDEHIEYGYASDEHLFTAVQGGPLRWGYVGPNYWQPAVETVFGKSSEQILREMPRKWLRKASATWLLRSGLSVEQVAQVTGHDPVQLFHHYAGFVSGYADRHAWTGWDDAWAWAVQERDVF